jgi:hypothetical protein
MWHNFVLFLNDLSPLFAILSTILWGIYVFYTIRTFREINMQTILQSSAVLVVTSQVCSIQPEKAIDKLSKPAKDLCNKWIEIIKKNAPTISIQNQYIVLSLSNRGRSDIISWQIRLAINIEPGDYLSKNLNISGEQAHWQGSSDIIEVGGKKDFLIAETGMFPISNYSWQIKFYDMREIEYVAFTGDKTLETKNVLILNYSP